MGNVAVGSRPHRPVGTDEGGAPPGAGPGARTGTAADAVTPHRLVWLDVLRGIGALLVAFHHAAPHYLPQLHARILIWFNPGTCGVIIFFLVSGYIIPASLERRGSLRRFWAGRFFRLYPLLCLALAATAALAWFGPGELRADLGTYDPATVVVAHLTTMQDLLAVPNAINVLWTLSYEMAFYFLVTALFAMRLHRRSAPVAMSLGILSVAVGGLLPMAALTQWAGPTPVVYAAAAVMAVALCAVALRRVAWRTAGAVLGGVLVLTLIVANGRLGPWQGLALLGLMFTGSVLYRTASGQLRRRWALLTVTVVWAGALLSSYLHDWERAAAEGDPLIGQRNWAITVTLGLLTFGTAMALRHRRLPRWLAAPGVISYSVYILHPLVLEIFDLYVPWPSTDTPSLVAVYFAVMLPLSWLSYRLVEAPMQRLGRSLVRRGPKALPVPRREAAPGVRRTG